LTVSVEYADEHPNGLATMVGGLIQANLDRDPGRRSLLHPSVVELVALDAGVSVGITLSTAGVLVANGSPRTRPRLRIRADSTELVLLSSVPLRLGMPDPFSADGRRTIEKVLSRKIRIAGQLRHPLTLARLTRLLSVA
jgi:hypothetical protein